MLPFLRSPAFVATTVLSLLFSAVSCSEDGGSTPTPKSNPSTPTTPANPGAVTGNVTPASSISRVTATPTSGAAISGFASGSDFLLQLPVGTYTISFTAELGYIAPANRTVTITSGQQSSLGTITVAMRNSFAWTTNTTGPFNYTASFPPGGTFTLNSGGASASLQFGATNRAGVDNTTVTINIPNANGPGTYTFNTMATAQYAYTGGSAQTLLTYPGSGSVTITSFSLANRRVVGTFNLRARTNINSVYVPNGAFDITF